MKQTFKFLTLFLLTLLGTSNLWAASSTFTGTFYFDMAKWTEAGATFNIKKWDGSGNLTTEKATQVNGNIYKITCTSCAKIQILRMDNNYNQQWNYSETMEMKNRTSDDQNKITMSSDNINNNATGTWGKISTITIYCLPGKLDYKENSNTYYFGTHGSTIKANVQGGDSYWTTVTMNADEGKTYNGYDIYKAEFVSIYGGVKFIQFQLFDGNSYKGKYEYTLSGSWADNSVVSGKIYEGYVSNAHKWSTYNYDVTLTFDPQNGDASTSKSVLKGGSITTPAAPSKTGYNFLGWSKDGGSTKVAANTTISDVQADATYYAQWEQQQIHYDYTFGRCTGQTDDMGTVASEPSTGSILAGTSITLTATPKTGYEVEGWYSNADCTSAKLQPGGNTYTFDIGADISVYVKFKEIDYTITLTKGTGINAIKVDGTAQDNVTAHVATKTGTITAEVATGYTWSKWTVSTNNITADPDLNTNGIQINATSTGTLTATATEILHSVSVASNDVNKGTVSTASVSGVGIATKSASITATPKPGYYFTGWDIPEGVTLAQGYNQQDATIQINATANSGTITANFAGKYSFRGSLSDGQDTQGGMPGWGNDTLIEFTNGTASVSYTLQANKTYKFKLRDKSTESGYAGYQTSGNINMNGNYHLFDGTNDVYLATQGAGEYTFDIRFNNGTPEVKVSGPTSYTITFGQGTGGSTISATSSIDGDITTGQYVKSGANVTFSQTAAIGHHFVEWNTQADGQGTQLGTDATLVLNNVTENKTVYSTYAKTDYNITYPSGTNYTIKKTKDIANYQDNVTFKATPKDGYRLEVTAKDASEQTVTLNHDDFSYDYSFSMPASSVTISVTEYPYMLGGNFTTGGENFDSEKYTFDENHQHTFTLNALTSYKFKIYNDNYTGQNDHYMGMEGNWDIDHTTLNSEVTCEGIACFVIKTGVAGNYTIKVKTGANNKPVVDIIYPNVSKLVYNGNDYPFTEVSSGVYKAGPLSLAASTTFNDDICMYWEGTCIKNDNDGTMNAGNHTDWGMERYTSGVPHYIKIATAGSDYTFAKNPDNYYFYYKPNASPKPALTVEYPSYWRGDAGTTLGWNYDHPMEFINDVATIELDVQTSGDREMKVIVDGQYWTYEGTKISTSTNDIQFVKDDQANKSSFKFNVAESMKGIYTFTFNRATHKMSVNYPDVVQYDITYTDAEGTKTIKAGPNGGRGISAANKPGYKFVRWELYPNDINKIAVVDNNKTRQTTTVYGKAEGCSITAIYTNEHFIYFKNIPNWSDVYVQFYSNPYFHGDDGTGDKNKGTGTGGDNNTSLVNGTIYHMTHIDKTDIWYFDYSAFASNATAQHTVAFTDSKQDNHSFFDQCQVVYRGDFGECAPMMVPINYIDQYLNQHNNQRTCYYGQGHWMKYDAAENEAMGIKLHIYNKVTKDGQEDPREIGSWDLLADNDGSYSSHITGINLPNADWKYGIKLSGCASGATWYGNTGTMTSAECTNWVMSINAQNMGFEAKSAGPYTFRLSTGDGQLKLSAEYPLVENDFRVIHTEGGNTHITDITYKHANTQADTASFYFNISETLPVFKVQKCTNASSDEWADVSGATFTNPNETGVYNFIFSHDGENVTIEKTEPYTGNFYVRCQALDGGLENYEANADNRMNYTTANPEFAANDQEGYNYYKTRWITNGKDVEFTVANDYSKNISATMTGDGIIGNDKHTLPADANVRFTWNSNTNALSRAYIRGSSNPEDKFVVVYGTYVFSDQECTQSLTNQAPGHFKDNQDWVYEYTLYAKTGATATVMTSYNDQQQYLISNQDIFSSTKEDDKAKLRTLYDFKTNRFVAAWTPSGDIESIYEISADIMLMRKGQAQADQMTFGEGGKITGAAKTIYGAVQFDKSLMALEGPGYEKYDRSIFWISFPFDVRLNDVFGLGQYGKYWIIRYYDGAERAQKGWFQETKTFWKTVSVEEREHGGEDGKGFVMKANEGYNLVLDYTAVLKDLYPNGATENYLFFPSKDKLTDIPASLQTESITYEPLTCTITSPEDRTNEDSNWRVIGVPSYADPGTITAAEGIKFYYAWNNTNNTLGVAKVPETNPCGGDNEGEFRSLHAYMVQFAGTINWKTLEITPATAPLFAQTEKEEYSLRLELQQEGKKVDQAYVDLTDEATENFDLNLDITKLMYSTSQIYSFIGTDKVAANSLPVQDVVVPLCVTAAANGTYTIALPDGTEGLNVTLYDVVAGQETNLSFGGYTVDLNKGEYNNRFMLNISVPKVPTSMENVDGGKWNVDGKTTKLLRNGNIYLINAGRVYNVLGVEE